MYKDYFGFTEDPFGITPDPRFFYENPIYREASAKLSWGVTERRGLMTLIGAVGTGKTTVLRHLMVTSTPAVRCIFAEYPASSFDELLAFVCREMGLPSSEAGGRLDRVTSLKTVLLESRAKNVTTAILLDEAQQLTDETLEGVRLLSNLETAGDKALQIVLAGQPELRAKLDQPSLAPLKQRITSWCRLDGLSYGEIAAYIQCRLLVAGYRGPELFGPTAVEAIGFYSRGVPRLVNVLCGDALVRAHRASLRVISSDVIVETARSLNIGPEFDFTPSRPSVPDVSSPSAVIPGPASIRREPPQTSSGAGRHARIPLRGGRPARPVVKRRWLWAGLGGLVCIAAGTGALALLRSHESSVKPRDDRSIARPVSPPESGSQAAVGASPDLSDRSPSGGPAPSAAVIPDKVVPSVTDAAATGPPADEANDRGARQGGLPSAVSGSAGDPAEHGPVPPPSRQPAQSVVLRGGTISGVAQDTFGKDMHLALDLLKDLNPEIDNLNWVLAGQRLRLPRLNRHDLVYRRRDGSFRLILNSFTNPADARRLSEAVNARGYAAILVPRRITDDLVLTRVEIKDLVDETAVRHAWQTARAAEWLPDEAPVAPGQSSVRP